MKRRGSSVADASVGPDAPESNHAATALAIVLGRLERRDEALAMLDRTIVYDRRVSGERSYNVASDLNNRCDLLTQMQRYDEAAADCRTAIAIYTGINGADSREVAIAYANVTITFLQARRLDDARASVNAALAILGPKFAGDPVHDGASILDAIVAARRGEPGARAKLEAAVKRPDVGGLRALATAELAKGPR
jgi:tetratricopeptide (TPR) repeat protein